MTPSKVGQGTSPAIFDPATCEAVFGGPARTIEVINKVTAGCARRQLRIITASGWTISCVWGFGTYCTAARPGTFAMPDNPAEFSPDAEVAAWRDGGSMIQLDDDTVAGWRSVEDVLDAAAAADRDDEDGIRQAFTRQVATSSRRTRWSRRPIVTDPYPSLGFTELLDLPDEDLTCPVCGHVASPRRAYYWGTCSECESVKGSARATPLPVVGHYARGNMDALHREAGHA